MTKKQQAFLDADIADRVRMAADVARRIATGGLASQDTGLESPEDDFLVMHWLRLLAGSQSERVIGQRGKIASDWDEALDHLAGTAYSLGVAVGLRQRVEAYEGAPPRSKPEAGGDR